MPQFTIPFFLYFIFVPGLFVNCDEMNVCNIDDSTCMPLEDFEENCTCLLLPDQNFFNVTDELFLFMDGYPIHMSYINQVEMEKLFRDKLSIRIPKAHYYSTTGEFNENIFRNMEISEKMALFLVDSSKTQQVLEYLIKMKFLRTNALTTPENRWCIEGECNAFVYESDILNRTAGTYSHVADLLQIIQFRGKSIFAVSSVYGSFSIPKAEYFQCSHKCKPFYYSEHEMCIKQCGIRLRFDQVAVTGDLKRNFDFFVQSSAIQNFRDKYNKYVDNYPFN